MEEKEFAQKLSKAAQEMVTEIFPDIVASVGKEYQQQINNRDEKIALHERLNALHVETEENLKKIIIAKEKEIETLKNGIMWRRMKDVEEQLRNSSSPVWKRRLRERLSLSASEINNTLSHGKAAGHFESDGNGNWKLTDHFRNQSCR